MSLSLAAGPVWSQGGPGAGGLSPELAAIVGAPEAPRIAGKLQVCALGDPVPCVLPDGRIAGSDDAGLAADAAADPEARAMAKALVALDAKAEAKAGKAGKAGKKAAKDKAAKKKEKAEPGQPGEGKGGGAEPPAPAMPEVTPVEVPEPKVPEVAAPPVPDVPKVEAPEVTPPDVTPPEVTPPEAAGPGVKAPEVPEVKAPEAPEVKPAEKPAKPAKEKKPKPKPAKEPPAPGAEAAEAPADSVAAPGETVEARDDAGLTEEQAKAEAEAQAAAQAAAEEVAAAAAAASDGAGEVIRETIDAKDVRSSGEDFAKGKGDADKAEKADKGDKADDKDAVGKDKGLSDFEKLAILGLGALVVGAILKNGDKVVSTSGDRVVVERPDGSVYILKNDDETLRQPGSNVETRRFADGSTLTTVTRKDGTEVRTVRDAEGRVLRRTKVLADGRSITLFDDTEKVAPVDVAKLPKERATEIDQSQDGDLEAALRRHLDTGVDRRFSLGQIRNIRAVRELVPIIDLDQITFDTGSAAISANEAEKLVTLGRAMAAVLADNPGEVFLIEGHTDAVGSATSNLTLSDRRAESLALALTEYFDIPPENMVVQGYGESYLKVPTLEANRENRRVAVRRITPLLVAQN